MGEPNSVTSALADCPAGTVLTGGGGDASNSVSGAQASVQLIGSQPEGNGWRATGVVNTALGHREHDDGERVRDLRQPRRLGVRDGFSPTRPAHRPERGALGSTAAPSYTRVEPPAVPERHPCVGDRTPCDLPRGPLPARPSARRIAQLAGSSPGLRLGGQRQCQPVDVSVLGSGSQ